MATDVHYGVYLATNGKPRTEFGFGLTLPQAKRLARNLINGLKEQYPGLQIFKKVNGPDDLTDDITMRCYHGSHDWRLTIESFWKEDEDADDE